MPRWLYTINVKDIWQDVEDVETLEGDEFERFKTRIVRRIKVSPVYSSEGVEDIRHVVWDLDSSVDMEDFAYFWDRLYDLADEFRIWIKTF